jgi:hypothetical protein
MASQIYTPPLFKRGQNEVEKSFSDTKSQNRALIGLTWIWLWYAFPSPIYCHWNEVYTAKRGVLVNNGWRKGMYVNQLFIGVTNYLI